MDLLEFAIVLKLKDNKTENFSGELQRLQMNLPWECGLISLFNSYLAFSFCHFSKTTLLQLGVYVYFFSVRFRFCSLVLLAHVFPNSLTLDCSQSPIFSWDRLDLPRLTVTAILIFKCTKGAGVGDYRPRPLSSFDTHARWQPVKRSAPSMILRKNRGLWTVSPHLFNYKNSVV